MCAVIFHYNGYAIIECMDIQWGIKTTKSHLVDQDTVLPDAIHLRFLKCFLDIPDPLTIILDSTDAANTYLLV